MIAYTAEQALKAENKKRFGSRSQLSSSQIDSIKEMVDNNFNGFRSADGTLMARHPLSQKWEKISNRDNAMSPEDVPTTWRIIGGYEGGVNSNAIDRYRILRNFRPMGDLALRYQVYRDESDAAAVCRILDAFGDISDTDTNNDGSFLHFTEYWPILIQAAIYVQDSSSYTQALDNKLKNTTMMLYEVLATAYARQNENNWVSWGLSLEFAVAGFVGDRQMHDNAVFKFKQHFRESIKSGWEIQQPYSPAQNQTKDNVAIFEVYRNLHLQSEPWYPNPGQSTTGGLTRNRVTSRGNGGRGLLYSNHALNGLTMAAEWARLNGTYLYDFFTSDGSSMKGFWESVAYMNRWSKGGPSPGGRNPQREEVLWFNVTGSPWDPQEQLGPRSFYWTRCPAYMNLLQTLWPNNDAAYYFEQNRYNTNSNSTEINYDLVSTSDTQPDPERSDIDHYGMRNTEFIYRRTGLKL